MKEGKRVGVWIRVSTEDQAKGESPEHHERLARYYAESKGWKIRKVYRLNAVSGKSVMGAQETQEMLEDVKKGVITGIIFSKLAKLARNTRELLEFADYFRGHDADLISLQEAIDTSTPAGRLFYTMVAVMAQWEREEISSRVSASVPVRARRGKSLGGQAVFGYKWENKKLVVDPDEAPVRKLMYEIFLETGGRKKTTARILNERGYRTRKGARFSDTTVDRLLRDPTAMGLRRANYTRSMGDNKKWKMKPKKEWIMVPTEPIVSKEIWEKCNKILDEQRKRRRKKRAKRPVHIFAGYVICHCGKKMYVPSGSVKYTCSACRNKIRTDDLEAIFHSQLKNFFLSPTEIENYLGRADKLIKEKETLLQSIKKEKSRIKADMDKIYKLFMNDGISQEGFKERYRPLEERTAQINVQIPELQGHIDFLKIQYLSSDEILHEARELYSRWDKLNKEEKIGIIQTITENIIIGKEDVTINLCYLPPFLENDDKKATHPYGCVSIVGVNSGGYSRDRDQNKAVMIL